MSEFPFLELTPLFIVGVQISTVANPHSFEDFHTSNGSDQLAVPYYESQGTQGCIPVNIGALGLSGVTDGSNVTLQLVQDGSDGQLYQVRRTFYPVLLLWLITILYCVVHGLDPFLDLPDFIQCPVREHHRDPQFHDQWWSESHLNRSRRWSFELGAGFRTAEPLCAWVLLLQPLLGGIFRDDDRVTTTLVSWFLYLFTSDGRTMLSIR